MNVELEHLEQLDRFFDIKAKIAGGLELNAELSREFRLILIEAAQLEAVEGFSDVLVHLEGCRAILSKMSFL